MRKALRRAAPFVFLLAASVWLACWGAWFLVPALREVEPIDGIDRSVARTDVATLRPRAHLSAGERYYLTYRVDAADARRETAVTAALRFSGNPRHDRQLSFARVDPGASLQSGATFDTAALPPDDFATVTLTVPCRTAALVHDVTLFRRSAVVHTVERLAAVLAILSAAAWAALSWRRRPRTVEALALAVCTFAVVSAWIPASRHGDPFWNTPTAMSLLSSGDATVDEFLAERRQAMPFLTTHHEGHVYNYFPSACRCSACQRRR